MKPEIGQSWRFGGRGAEENERLYLIVSIEPNAVNPDDSTSTIMNLETGELHTGYLTWHFTRANSMWRRET